MAKTRSRTRSRTRRRKSNAPPQVRNPGAPEPSGYGLLRMIKWLSVLLVISGIAAIVVFPDQFASAFGYTTPSSQIPGDTMGKKGAMQVTINYVYDLPVGYKVLIAVLALFCIPVLYFLIKLTVRFGLAVISMIRGANPSESSSLPGSAESDMDELIKSFTNLSIAGASNEEETTHNLLINSMEDIRKYYDANIYTFDPAMQNKSGDDSTTNENRQKHWEEFGNNITSIEDTDAAEFEKLFPSIIELRRRYESASQEEKAELARKIQDCPILATVFFTDGKESAVYHAKRTLRLYIETLKRQRA